MSRTIPCVASHFGTKVYVDLTTEQLYADRDCWCDERVEVTIDNPETGEVVVTDVRLADLTIEHQE